MFVDTHAHLDMIQKPLEEVLSRAKSSGVTEIITVGINLESSARAVSLSKEHENVSAVIGIHPNDCGNCDISDLSGIEAMARENPAIVRGIGETGLDFYRKRSSEKVQEEFFRAHCEAAKRLGLALVVHDRQAHERTLKILSEEMHGYDKVVMHCFSGDSEMARYCSSEGYYISFSGPITFSNNKKASETVKAAALDKLLIETDCPFLSPHPLRGKANEPSTIPLIAAKMADYLNLSTDKLAEITRKNSISVFGLKS